jgi:hypothetical protein
MAVPLSPMVHRWPRAYSGAASAQRRRAVNILAIAMPVPAVFNRCQNQPPRLH